MYPPTCQGPAGTHVRAALVGAVREWQAAGHTVVYLVCQRGGAAPGDEEIFRQLNAELGAAAQPIETRTLAADAPTIAQQLGDLTVICGMRFHALVLAAMLGRPFIGLAHDNKISEICRTFTMPCKVDLEKVHASVKDGILTVRVGKAAEAKPRKIQVTASR